jgi:hypothetical protein
VNAGLRIATWRRPADWHVEAAHHPDRNRPFPFLSFRIAAPGVLVSNRPSPAGKPTAVLATAILSWLGFSASLRTAPSHDGVESAPT